MSLTTLDPTRFPPKRMQDRGIDDLDRDFDYIVLHLMPFVYGEFFAVCHQ